MKQKGSDGRAVERDEVIWVLKYMREREFSTKQAGIFRVEAAPSVKGIIQN